MADYVPTQVLAELFKNNDFDGVAYGSALGNGLNIVLFDLATARLCSCTLFETTSIRFSFSQVDNAYYT